MTQQASVPQSGAGRPPRRPLVLVVDDVPEYLTLLGELLAPHYTVKVANSGARALHVAAEEPPDLVLLDVMMPVMDGYAVLEAMRHDPVLSDIPVIFVTGLEGPADQSHGFAAGAADYVVKPYNAQIVLARVRAHLEIKQARDQLREQNALLASESANRARIEAEVRLLNAKLRARSHALERSVRDLRAFGYSISHDLRAPLRAIGGFAQLLQETEAPRLSDDGRGMLAHITDGVGRMERMIADVLAYSNAEAVEVSMGPVDLRTIAREVADELAPAYPDSTVTIGELPVVEADRTMVRQILANLIGNALKFSAKSPRPRVEVVLAAGGGVPAIVVRDNGVGFDPSRAQRIFGLFQRLHTEKAFPGTGVGLAIVKRLVERHGGSITFDSTPGEGTTFRFTLCEDAPAAA
jgi:two-component system, sensor histidine kinase and response regulator